MEEERLQRMQEQQTAEKKDAMQQELLRRAARKSVSLMKQITSCRHPRTFLELSFSSACVQLCSELYIHNQDFEKSTEQGETETSVNFIQ